MKNINKVKTIIILLLFAFFAAPTLYADDSGSCGDNINWNYNTNTYTLIISGRGICVIN
jgi:hypothetical protein